MQTAISCEIFANVTGVLLSFSSDNYESQQKTKESSKKNGPQHGEHGNRVLMVGLQRELALYRAEVLRQAGFSVTTPSDSNEALLLMYKREYDVVILSYTLPRGVIELLAKASRKFCSDCQIVAISDGDIPELQNTADAVALANEGPAALIATLKRVLHRV